MPQPLNPFQQTTQHLPVGGLHVQRQGDHVVNHHMRRQFLLSLAVSSGGHQYRFHDIHRKRLGHDPKADVIP